jgi:hypothetical protein
VVKGNGIEPGTSNELHLYIKKHTRDFQCANCRLVRYLRLISSNSFHRQFTFGLFLDKSFNVFEDTVSVAVSQLSVFLVSG